MWGRKVEESAQCGPQKGHYGMPHSCIKKSKNYKTIYLKPFGVYINMLDLKP